MGEERLILNENYEQLISDLLLREYSVIDGFFNPEVLAGLKQRLEIIEKQDMFAPAMIGNKVNRTLNVNKRSDKIYWIDENEGFFEKQFFSEVQELVRYLNFHCFAGLRGSEFHFARYESGAFYEKHLDCFKGDVRRKFSMVTYLNEEWTEENEGNLVLYPIGKDPVKVLPQFGRTVIFKSADVLHEVQKANRSRYSITGWLK